MQVLLEGSYGKEKQKAPMCHSPCARNSEHDSVGGGNVPGAHNNVHSRTEKEHVFQF